MSRPSANQGRVRTLALGLVLAAPSAARAGKVETAHDDARLYSAFGKVLEDPFFERFTGLKIIEEGRLSEPARYVGGTKAFRFVNACSETTINETPVEERTTHSWGTRVTKYTERKTTTKTSTNMRMISYLPTLEVPSKRKADGKGKLRLYVGTGRLGEKTEAGINPWKLLGGLAGAIAKGMAMGVRGEREWSAGGGCSWSPFNPGDYAAWIEDRWLGWRLEHFAAGKDELAEAFDLFSKKRYADALPYFERFAKHFGHQKRKNTGADKDVFPFEYQGSVPEIYAILGDIYRLGLGDLEKAEEAYWIGSSIAWMPYLAETAGLARANRGLGLALAERARKSKDDPRKFAILGERAAFFLYAYMGWYKDRTAPDHGEVMALIREVDPEQLRRQAEDKEGERKMAEEGEARKERKAKVKDLMEY